MKDVVIIGAGIAGLTAAIYAVRAGKDVLILEEKMYGGQIVNSHNVENYPGIKSISGIDLAMALYEQATSLGAEFDYRKVLGIKDNTDTKLVVTDSGEIECKNIIIAVGAKNRKLGVDGEEALVGRGISYCATCDGAFFRGHDVAIAGGGNTALMDAKYLASLCNKVYIIHRRDTFRAEQAMVDEVLAMENVVPIMDANVCGFVAGDFLEGVVVKDKKTNEETKIDVAGLFVAVGQEPDTARFADVVEVDSYGYIVADETTKTNVQGIFAAGDCRTKVLRQLITAAADGAVAAEMILE